MIKKIYEIYNYYNKNDAITFQYLIRENTIDNYANFVNHCKNNNIKITIPNYEAFVLNTPVENDIVELEENNKRMFNDNQLKAINSKNDNICVMASAGSGKTSVFVDRIKKAIFEDKVKNEYILALTFTDKASKEFQKRLNVKNLNIGTFHSVFFKLLKRYVDKFKGYKIYEENSYQLYLENNFNDMFKEKEIAIKIGGATELNSIIDKNINVILECKTFADYKEKLKEILVKDKQYIDSNNLIDNFYAQKAKDKIFSFNDIMIFTYFEVMNLKTDSWFDIFLNNLELIAVDEFQDNNKIVNFIIKKISNKNLFLVGDVYQSIYSFNNSSFKNTLELIEDMQIVQLDTNYRSSENIVNFDNRFIDKIIKDKTDKIKVIKDSGSVVNNNITIAEYINDYSIAKLIVESDTNMSDIAILARTNKQLEEVKDILQKYNIPYNEKNYTEFSNLLNSIVLNLLGNYDFEDKYFDRFNFDFKYRATNQKQLYDAFVRVIKDYNIIGYLTNRGFADLETKINSYIFRIMNMFSHSDFENVLNSMENLLDIFLEKKEYLEKKGVNVLTIHKSKGLEWETVILYDFEDKVFPRNLHNEEEKRVYYVAITRAKSNLILTSKKNINTWTDRIITDYCDYVRLDDKNRFSFDYNYDYIDNIDFDRVVKYKITDFDKIKIIDTDKYIKTFLDNSNDTIQKHILNNLNNINIEDVESVLFDIEDFKKDNLIDNIDLKNSILNIDTDKKLFFTDGVINSTHLNECFSIEIHKILNFKNWVSEWTKIDEIEIKKFKKLVKNIVSKTHTDLTKDRAKKLLEIEQRHINNKLKDMRLESYSDFINYMFKNYYEKSENEKDYYYSNMLTMYDTLNKKELVDFTDIKYQGMLKELALEHNFDKENNDYLFSGEMLGGNFLNNRKTRIANQRIAKVKYIEHVAKTHRPWFLTFTLPTEWHRWKMSNEGLKDKQKRIYGDESILKENENFILQGHNFHEHIAASAKKMNAIWTDFYHMLKTNISNLKEKNTKLVKKGKMTQAEFDAFIYDSIYFFKTLEPHKNMTAHAHVLVFVDDKFQKQIYKTYHSIIRKHGLNESFQDIKKIFNNNDTEVGKLFNKVENLKTEIKLLESNSIKKIETLRAEIKDYDNLYSVNSILSNIDYKSKNELKRELKEVLKSEREVYIKIKKLTKQLVKLEEELNNLHKRNGIELFNLEEQLKLAKSDKEKSILEQKIKETKHKSNFNFASPVSYIFKYQMKNMKVDISDENNIENEEVRVDNVVFFNAWESLLGAKSKLVSMSNYNHTTQLELNKIYNFHNEFFPAEIDRIKETNKPLYIYFEELKIAGKFNFNYENRLKESFNRVEFLNEVEEVFKKLLEDKEELPNKYLYSVATNIVLNGSENNFVKFLTHKKLMLVDIDSTWIEDTMKSKEELLEDFRIEIEENPHISFLEPIDRYNILLENLSSNVVDNRKVIYKDGQFINGTIIVKDIIGLIDFAIDESYINGLKAMDNYRDTWKKNLIPYFKEDRDFKIEEVKTVISPDLPTFIEDIPF